MTVSSSDKPGGSRSWLSVAEVADELRMSPMTLYRLIDRGGLPAVRFGRRLVIPARVLDEMANAAIESGGTVHSAEWRGGAA